MGLGNAMGLVVGSVRCRTRWDIRAVLTSTGRVESGLLAKERLVLHCVQRVSHGLFDLPHATAEFNVPANF